jgi:hypothetical protein
MRDGTLEYDTYSLSGAISHDPSGNCVSPHLKRVKDVDNGVDWSRYWVTHLTTAVSAPFRWYSYMSLCGRDLSRVLMEGKCHHAVALPVRHD